jgi:hypothetical protein
MFSKDLMLTEKLYLQAKFTKMIVPVENTTVMIIIMVMVQVAVVDVDVAVEVAANVTYTTTQPSK